MDRLRLAPATAVVGLLLLYATIGDAATANATAANDAGTNDAGTEATATDATTTTANATATNATTTNTTTTTNANANTIKIITDDPENFDEIINILDSTNASMKGPNVCETTHTYEKKIYISEEKLYKIYKPHTCSNKHIFGCLYLNVKKYPKELQKVMKKRKLFRHCCTGYKPSPNRTTCVPVCEKPCKWGKCILPNQCQCDKLYAGDVCDKRIAVCALGSYGVNCEKKCHCSDNAFCDPIGGHCLCPTGLTGPHCNLTCPTGFYGYQCRHRCKCPNSNGCNPIDGSDCVCKQGWTGLTCTIPCVKNTYGFNCTGNCNCFNGGFCRSSDGVCFCKPGFHGHDCSKVCPKNFYGKLCLKQCNCNLTSEICNNAKGCISNSIYTTTYLVDRENKEFIWIIYILVMFSLILFMLTGVGIFVYYTHYKRQKIKDQFNRDNAWRSKLRINMDENFLPISIIGRRGQSTSCTSSYTNKMFYLTYGHSDRSNYKTYENLYFEIDENSPRRGENQYDHLDFLRPTGSWKPHYQKALVMQEHQDQSTSNTSTSSSISRSISNSGTSIY